MLPDKAVNTNVLVVSLEMKRRCVFACRVQRLAVVILEMMSNRIVPLQYSNITWSHEVHVDCKPTLEAIRGALRSLDLVGSFVDLIVNTGIFEEAGLPIMRYHSSPMIYRDIRST